MKSSAINIRKNHKLYMNDERILREKLRMTTEIMEDGENLDFKGKN